MKEVGAFEAETKFGQSLDWVEAGEEIIITRRGKIVARLLPPVGNSAHEEALAAAARIRARRRGITLSGLKIKT